MNKLVPNNRANWVKFGPNICIDVRFFYIYWGPKVGRFRPFTPIRSNFGCKQMSPLNGPWTTRSFGHALCPCPKNTVKRNVSWDIWFLRTPLSEPGTNIWWDVSGGMSPIYLKLHFWSHYICRESSHRKVPPESQAPKYLKNLQKNVRGVVNFARLNILAPKKWRTGTNIFKAQKNQHPKNIVWK